MTQPRYSVFPIIRCNNYRLTRRGKIKSDRDPAGSWCCSHMVSPALPPGVAHTGLTSSTSWFCLHPPYATLSHSWSHPFSRLVSPGLPLSLFLWCDPLRHLEPRTLLPQSQLLRFALCSRLISGNE